jgi:hypothetical protein
MVFIDGGFVSSFELEGVGCIGGMALAQMLGLGDGSSGDWGTGSFVEARLGWTRTGPGGGIAALLALSAPATTWVASAVRIGWHGWRVCRIGHPLTSGRGAGVYAGELLAAGGWIAAGGHPTVSQ